MRTEVSAISLIGPSLPGDARVFLLTTQSVCARLSRPFSQRASPSTRSLRNLWAFPLYTSVCDTMLMAQSHPNTLYLSSYCCGILYTVWLLVAKRANIPIPVGRCWFQERCATLESTMTRYHHGRTIKEARGKLGMTQAKLAEVWPKDGSVSLNEFHVPISHPADAN